MNNNKTEIANISKIDLFWNISATFLKVAAAALLFPFILRYFSSEIVGVWTIFMTVTSLIALLDFGFTPSFTRNVSYVFSGVKTLKVEGVHTVNVHESSQVDFGLLKGLISAMKWFYSRGALILLILSLLGTVYIYYLLIDFSGNKMEVYIAWIILCVNNTYSFYTMYYESLLQGKGLIKRNKQIVIIGRLFYLVVAIILILNGAGLLAVVASQLLSTCIMRILFYKVFFTNTMKQQLAASESKDKMGIIRTIYPNAVKIGLVFCGSAAVNQATVFIGSAFLSLSEVASYGITLQVITILVTLSKLYLDTYYPKIVQYRSVNDFQSISGIYRKGKIYFITIFIAGSLSLLLLGDFALNLIGSQTQFLAMPLIGTALCFALLDTNQVLASNILLAGNEVPFLKSNLWTGGISILMILFFISICGLKEWSLILGPGLTQIVYQDWKWPHKVHQLLF